MVDPQSRIARFLRRMTELCEEAGLPAYDAHEYATREETLIVLWREPDFVLAIPLRTARILDMTPEELHAAWIRKFGGDWRQRLARRSAAGEGR